MITDAVFAASTAALAAVMYRAGRRRTALLAALVFLMVAGALVFRNLEAIPAYVGCAIALLIAAAISSFVDIRDATKPLR